MIRSFEAKVSTDLLLFGGDGRRIYVPKAEMVKKHGRQEEKILVKILCRSQEQIDCRTEQVPRLYS